MIIVGLILIVLIAGKLAYKPKTTTPPIMIESPLTTVEQAKPGTFSGKITNVIEDCHFDGICSLSIGSKSVIFELGGDVSPDMEKERGSKGKLLDSSDTPIGTISKEMIGKEVEVYAKPRGTDTYTIYGNKDYYIKFK